MVTHGHFRKPSVDTRVEQIFRHVSSVMILSFHRKSRLRESFHIHDHGRRQDSVLYRRAGDAPIGRHTRSKHNNNNISLILKRKQTTIVLCGSRIRRLNKITCLTSSTILLDVASLSDKTAARTSSCDGTPTGTGSSLFPE